MQGVIGVVLAFLASMEAGIEANTNSPLLCPSFQSPNVKRNPTRQNCYFTINGLEITMDFQNLEDLVLDCNNNDLSVDNPELPVAQKPLTLKKINITDCKVPSNGSYLDALKTMNFAMSDNCIVYLKLPASPKLESHHLRDLNMSELYINAKDTLYPPRPASDYLKYVAGLRSLKLENVIPEENELMPLEIEKLHLEYTHLAERTNGSAWLERLQSLRVFYLQENMKSNKFLFALPKFYLLPKLEEVILNEVPLDLGTLAGSLNGSSMFKLVLNSCGLHNISNEMFVGTNVTELNLESNQLVMPEGVLSGLEWLTILEVSNTGIDGEALKRMVSPLKRLEILKATDNPLGSLCGDVEDTSAKLSSGLPKSLQNLDLQKTGATRICPDWTTNEALMNIDLSNNNIGNLTLSQLTMRRNVSGKVNLCLIDNPKLRMSGVSRVDVELFVNETYSSEVSNDLTRAQVTVELKNLICDCDSQYWLPKALRSPLLNIDDFEGCVSETSDSATVISTTDDPEEIQCQYNGVCHPNCSCWRGPSDNRIVVQCATQPSEQWLSSTSRGNNIVLHVKPGVLSSVPRHPLIELYAPNNNITMLGIEDIPKSLRVLDVRNNSIQHISEAAAQRLKDNRVNVTLAGNQLACACSDTPAFELLQFVVHDWKETQCSDHSLVLEKMESGLCNFPILLVLPSIFCVVLVMFIVGFSLDKYQSQIRKYLFKLNLCRRYIFNVKEKADSDKTVDVFLSYAYPDWELLNELRAGLESRGYTTLEHCRDWLPGNPIHEQIARSVLCARRTVLLVSDNYAKSKWALEEFHTAHAHAMERQTARVLIVRWNLNEPCKLPSDLQTYLRYNTYLDWYDEKFWEKLCQYMPMLRFGLVRQEISIAC